MQRSIYLGVKDDISVNAHSTILTPIPKEFVVCPFPFRRGKREWQLEPEHLESIHCDEFLSLFAYEQGVWDQIFVGRCDINAKVSC